MNDYDTICNLLGRSEEFGFTEAQQEALSAAADALAAQEGRRIAVGKVGEPAGRWFDTVERAEIWLTRQKRIDPEGVERGDYYIDVPEDLQR